MSDNCIWIKAASSQCHYSLVTEQVCQWHNSIFKHTSIISSRTKFNCWHQPTHHTGNPEWWVCLLSYYAYMKPPGVSQQIQNYTDHMHIILSYCHLQYQQELLEKLCTAVLHRLILQHNKTWKKQPVTDCGIDSRRHITHATRHQLLQHLAFVQQLVFGDNTD